MKRFIYLIIFLVVLLSLKAFYLDPYLSEKYGDSNQSAEVNESVESNDTVENLPETKEEAPTAKQSSQASKPQEKMPLDKLGDSIADKLQDKIGKH